MGNLILALSAAGIVFMLASGAMTKEGMAVAAAMLTLVIAAYFEPSKD